MATPLDDRVSSCTDSELAALIRERSTTLEEHAGIVLLSSGYLAKCYDLISAEDTIKSMEVVHSLGIRAPRFVRTIECEDGLFIIMERIKWDTLEDVWPSLGWYTSFQLELQLCRFILEMRSITSTMAGSLATGECRSF